ncbi:MAG: histidine--tRNA ligase family protein [Dehalococcoidia bacterium]|nr:histidine--tRNA ligase family protein [Dehalococcoidia bacterium]
MSVLSGCSDKLKDHLSLWGYASVDTPMLEETELFLRKSGSEVITRLYSLTDQSGRRLSLRPEFTASVIKAYVTDYSSSPLPVRWQYGGPVFRYGSRYGPFGQSHQVGAELIGSSSPLADAEVIAAACKGLEICGLDGYKVVVGHAGLLPGLLDDLHLSQRSKNLLLRNIQSLKEGQEGIERLRGILGRSSTESTDDPGNEPALNAIADEGTLTIFRKLLTGAGEQFAGSRSAAEIIGRFSEKLTAARYEDLDKAVSLMTELANIHGGRVQALAAARGAIRRYGLSDSALDRLEKVLEILERCYAVTSVKVDLGLLRGLAYYTGPIFEINLNTDSESNPVCGGGRYDGLVRALGGDDVPALGFAYYLERISNTLGTNSMTRPAPTGTVLEDTPQHLHLELVIPASEVCYSAAVAEAERRRGTNQLVTVEAVERTVEDSLQYAAACGMSRAVVVGEAGIVREYFMTENGWSYAASSASK